MLGIQADFYVAACKIVSSVSLITGFAVNGITGNCSTTFQIFHKLCVLSVLVDPVSVLIPLNGHIRSR